MEKFDENVRTLAKGMHEKGWKYLIFISDPTSGQTDYFFTKSSGGVGPRLREDWPTYRVDSVWNLDSVFGRP